MTSPTLCDIHARIGLSTAAAFSVLAIQYRDRCGRREAVNDRGGEDGEGYESPKRPLVDELHVRGRVPDVELCRNLGDGSDQAAL